MISMAVPSISMPDSRRDTAAAGGARVESRGPSRTRSTASWRFRAALIRPAEGLWLTLREAAGRRFWLNGWGACELGCELGRRRSRRRVDLRREEIDGV